MPATSTPSTLPRTSWPAWPMAVDCGKFGIFEYGIFLAFANSSAKAPRPEPRTRAIFGRSFVCLKMNFAAASARSNSPDFREEIFFALKRISPRCLRTEDSPWYLPAWREHQILQDRCGAQERARRYRRFECRWS